MWIEIFRTGNHTSKSGETIDYDAEKLKLIEQTYNQKVLDSASFEAPLVKGHPNDNDPAFGWVEKLARKGDRLLAKLKDLNNDIVNDVRAGKFKKISVALYPDLMLRHVGLLGAASPAVKGLKPVSFSENSDFREYSEFRLNILKDRNEMESEINSLKNENKTLKEQINLISKEKRLKEFRLFAEDVSLKKQIITPAQTKDLIDIFESVHVNSGESSNEIINKIKSFVEAIEPLNITKELNEHHDLSGFNSDKDKIHSKAIEIKNSDPDLSYEEAVLEAQSFFINNLR